MNRRQDSRPDQALLRALPEADAALQFDQLSAWLTEGGAGEEPPTTPADRVPSPSTKQLSLAEKLFPTVLKLGHGA